MSNPLTRKALDRALARIALAADDKDAADKEGDGADEQDDQPQGDPTKAQAPPGAPKKDSNLEPIDEGPRMDPDEEETVEDDGDEMFTLEDVIECFLRANPNPTDDQVHALAELLGLGFEDFEALIFEKFGEAVRLSLDRSVSEDDDEDDEGDLEPEGSDEGDDADLEDDEDDDQLVVDDELDVQDDLDMFIVAYIMFNPQPTDEQIHQLAFVVDLTKEEMEQRIYRMLGSYLQVQDDGQDFDAQGVEVDSDEEGGDEDEAADDETDDEEDDPDAGDDDAPDDGADDEETK